MCYIAIELAELGIDGANGWISRWACWVIWKVEPESIPVRASSVVADEFVVRVLYPERSWSLVSNQQAKCPPGVKDKIANDLVVGLDTILNKDTVSNILVDDIALKTQLAHCMEGDTPVIAGVDDIILDV